VIRPVAFAVAIIMLVYVPLLGLEGVEGRMFRPMATTMAFALLGALIYSVVFLPALLALFVPPLKKDGARWLRAARPRLRPRGAGGAALALAAARRGDGGAAGSRAGCSRARAPTSCRASTRATWW
jgi:multidrug efflux pump subunit AcrB